MSRMPSIDGTSTCSLLGGGGGGGGGGGDDDILAPRPLSLSSSSAPYAAAFDAAARRATDKLAHTLALTIGAPTLKTLFAIPTSLLSKMARPDDSE